MYGSIFGDIVGSIIEVKELEAFRNTFSQKRNYVDRISVLKNDYPLINEECSYTDDTVLTIAIADALLTDKNYEKKLRDYGIKELNLGVDKYGRSRFGSGFVKWLMGEKEGNSYGNGASMRISSIGFLCDSIEDIKKEVQAATIPSHNNEEAIKGAMCVAEVIFLAKNGYDKEYLKKYIEDNYYQMNYDLEELRKNYKFSSKTNTSIPVALFCFLESNDFIDSIRVALSVGGDSDTIACIVGGISEAFYNIPDYLIKEINNFLPNEYIDIIDKFYSRKNNIKINSVKGLKLTKNS